MTLSKRVTLLTSLPVLLSISLLCPSVTSSTFCSIFPLLNCSCFQSNNETNSTSWPSTLYSHLYCQGDSLSEQTFREPFGPDFDQQNHLRTLSMEFSLKSHVEVRPHQFDSLAQLFSNTDRDSPVEIFLRFNGFSSITFHEHSLGPKLFGSTPQNRRLWLYLIPERTYRKQVEPDELNDRSVEDQFNFSSNCFSGLSVSHMAIYAHTPRDEFPAACSFERIFNNTNVGELHFYGSIIRPSSSPRPEGTFTGRIRSLTLHRRVDTIDANAFPYYPHVLAYTIHSIEAHSMNLGSFWPSHLNLRRLEIIRPRFQLLIDQFLPTLDSLTIDVEELNESTLFAARHMYRLKLGSRLRRVDVRTLLLLEPRLHHLDLSDVELSQMTTDSRCRLIEYIHANHPHRLNIILPRTDNLTECDCARLFISHIQLSPSLRKFLGSSTCAQLCYLSECPTISEYFREAHPLPHDDGRFENATIGDENDSNPYLSSVDLLSDPADTDTIEFLVNLTSDHEAKSPRRSSTTAATHPHGAPTESIWLIHSVQEYDDKLSLSTPKLFEPLDESAHRNQSRHFPSTSPLLGVGFALLLLLVIACLLVLLFRRYRNTHRFKPLPVCV